MSPRVVEGRQNVLRKNHELARSLRMQFRAAGVFVVTLVSSPGAGKTELLQRTLTEMRVTRRVAALVGDLATDQDARSPAVLSSFEPMSLAQVRRILPCVAQEDR